MKQLVPSRLAGPVAAAADPWRSLPLLGAAVALAPLAALGWLAAAPHEPVWGHLWQTVLPGQIRTTLALCLGVALLTGLVGTLSAWWVTFYAFPGRRLLAWALLLPLAMPTYLIAYSYGDVLDQAGPLYRLWQAWLPHAAWPDFRSLPGAVLLLSGVLYPYVYLSARAAFVQQSAVLIEAGRALGLSPAGCFFRVALPMARPAVVVGMALAMMECLNDIGAVEFLGVTTLTMGVYDTWLVRGSLGGAAQIALTLLGFMALLLVLERSQRGRAGHYLRQGRRRSLPRFTAAPAAQAGMLAFCSVPVLLGFVVPVLLLLEAAAADPVTGLGSAALRSVTLAAAAALLTCGLGLILTYAVHADRRQPVWPGRLAATGYAVPGTVLAIGVMVALAELADASGGLIVLGGTAAALVFAYAVRFLSLAHGTLEAGFGRLSPGLDLAARSLGSSRTAALWLVHMPLLRAPLTTAAILVFVDVMKELPATLILRPFNFETLATTVYTYASVGQLEDAALPALLIVGVGLAPVLISLRLIDRQRG